MAKIKNTDEFDLDNEDFGFNFDDDELGGFFDGQPNVPKRSVFRRLAGGFKDGVKAAFIDPSTHGDMIKTALPKGYNQIYDSVDFTLNSVGSLQRDVTRGMRDNKEIMKRSMRELLPAFGDFGDSTKLGKTIKNWSEEVRRPQTDDVDPEKAFMTTEMGDTFGEAGAAAISNDSRARRARADDIAEDGQRKLMEHASRTSQIMSDRINLQQNNDIIKHLMGARQELMKLTSYQEQITQRYQRKSLEMQYRHYFVSRKSLDVLSQSLELSKSAYDKIITNTALPEAVKIQSSEHAHMILREKFLGEVINPASARFRSVGMKILQKSKTKVQEFFRDLGANLGNFSDLVGGAFGPDTGLDPAETFGDAVGRGAGKWGAKKLAAKVATKLAGHKKLARFGQAGASFINNGGRVFQSMLKNDTGFAPFEWLKSTGFLDEFAYRRDETLRKDATNMLDQQAMYDQKSRKALTEVIPGLLEKNTHYTRSILAFMRKEPEPEMERYNYSSGLFESDKVIRKRIKEETLGKSKTQNTAQALRNFVGEFEQQRKLSPEARKALMKVGLDESLSGGMMNLEAYSRGDKRWHENDKINQEIQNAFMENFYADYKEGVEGESKGIMGDINRTFRRGEMIGRRDKLHRSLQGISDNQGIYNMDSMLNNLNASGGNTMIDLGLAKQDGNKIVMNRQKIDDHIFKQAMQMDVGYLTSNVFDLEDGEYQLGQSVNSRIKKMINDLDRQYSRTVSPKDLASLRAVFEVVSDHIFAGDNQKFLNMTDADLSVKRRFLSALVIKFKEWMKTDAFEKLGEDAQEYFKTRFDIINDAARAAKVSAPLRDFMSKPLHIDDGAWGKSKSIVLSQLKDAGLDEEVLAELEKSIKNVKDATGKTVDMRLAELTGTKTYGDAARLINQMSDKGLKWLTKALADPNRPAPPVTDAGGMFKHFGRTADYMSKHSAVGRWVYRQFLNADSAINNSYENIQANQGLHDEINKLDGNSQGGKFWYDDQPDDKKSKFRGRMNPLVLNHNGIWSQDHVESTLKRGRNGDVRGGDTDVIKDIANQISDERKRIIERTVETGLDIFRDFADKATRYMEKGTTRKGAAPDFIGPMPKGSGSEEAPPDVDVEIHHSGGIVGSGRKYTGRGFGTKQRYHTGGIVRGDLQIQHASGHLGLMHAILPNGQQITAFDHQLAKKGNRATAQDFENAIKRARSKIQSKYKRHFKSVNEPKGNDHLKPDEVPAVLQRGEEVLTAKDPRHRNNFDRTMEQGTLDGQQQFLAGIYENTTIANQILQQIAESGLGGKAGDLFNKAKAKVKSGWLKAKTKVGSTVQSIKDHVSNGYGSIPKAIWDYGAGKMPLLASAGSWAFNKAKDGYAGAKERGGRLVEKLKDKIPTLEEIKTAGGVVVEKVFVPFGDFVSKRYEATKEWWKEHHPKFKLNFGEFWTTFKEKGGKIADWTSSKAGNAYRGVKNLLSGVKNPFTGILQAPGAVKNWVGKKIRGSLAMLRGFMSGGAWAAMKYRNVEEITDTVSGLRQVYMGIVDLQSIVMDRMPKPKTFSVFDKDGDGKRDKFLGWTKREDKEPKLDKDGKPLPGQEKKSKGFLNSFFGASMVGMAIRALLGGLVGNAMSHLFGVDLGFLGNTAVGMATVAGGAYAAKKLGGWALGKAGDAAKAGAGKAWDKVRGKKGKTGKAGVLASALSGAASDGCGCCCCNGGSGMDIPDIDPRKRKRKGRGAKGQAPTKAGSGVAGAVAESAASEVAQNATKRGGMFRGSGAKVAGGLALAAGAYGLYQVAKDDTTSTADKVRAGSNLVGSTAGGMAGAALGASVGSVVPVVGTVIGGVLGGMAGSYFGGKVGDGVGSAITPSPETEKQATLGEIQRKSQTGEKLTAEEKQVLTEASSKEPNILVTLLKYSPIGLAWFAANGLIRLITGTLGLVWDGVKWVASTVGKVASCALGLVGSAIGGVAGMIWNGTKFIVGTAAKVVGGAASLAWDGVKWVTSTTGKIIGGAAGLVWDGTKWVAKTAWNIATAPARAAAWVAGKVYEGGKAAVSTVWNAGANVVKGAYDAGKTVVKGAWDVAATLAKGAYDVVSKPIKAVAKNIKGQWKNANDIYRNGDVSLAKMLSTNPLFLIAAGLKHLSSDNSPITRFRFIQYGFDMEKNKYYKAIMALETDLLGGVRVPSGNKPTLSPKRPFEEYLEMFDVSQEKKEEVDNWLTWFHYRFKPVFLSHISEWNKVMRNTKLHDGDKKLGRTPAKEYLKNVHYKNSERAPYIKKQNPFGDDSTTLYDVKYVNQAFEEALKAVESFPDKTLGASEKQAIGLSDPKFNKAFQHQEQLQAAKAERDRTQEEKDTALKALKGDDDGLWSTLKSKVRDARDWALGTNSDTKDQGTTLGVIGRAWDSAGINPKNWSSDGDVGDLGGVKSGPDGRTLSLTAQDVIDIAKVTFTEVTQYLSETEKGKMAAAVVDTILNRVVSGLWGNTVRSVVNAKYQFSAISGNSNAVGSVQNFPWAKVNKWMKEFVLSYLKKRASGGPSIVGGHLSYLNPFVSSQNSLRQWGNYVVQQAQKTGMIFGKGKAVHYHGTTKENIKKMPGAFKVRVEEGIENKLAKMGFGSAQLAGKGEAGLVTGAKGVGASPALAAPKTNPATAAPAATQPTVSSFAPIGSAVAAPVSGFAPSSSSGGSSAAPLASGGGSAAVGSTDSGKGAFFVGDSIADGFRKNNGGSGMTKVGANPKTVMTFLQATVLKNPSAYKSRTVYLSTGMSNDFSQTATIAQQMSELQSAGIKAHVFGVSNTYPKKNPTEMNNFLQQLCHKHGMKFLGGFNAGSDNIHPANYSLASYGSRAGGTGTPAASPLSSNFTSTAPVGIAAPAVVNSGKAQPANGNTGKNLLNTPTPSVSKNLSDLPDYKGTVKGGAPSVGTIGKATATPWMDIAKKQVGVNEKDHPNLIQEYHSVGGKIRAGGGTPWCASFVGWCLTKAGLKGTGSAAAASYVKFGQPLKVSSPIPYGAIMVIRFGTGNHVAFCESDQGSKVTMLGGNQSSKKTGDQRNGGEVTLSTISKSNVVAVVYPNGYTPGSAKTTPDNISSSYGGGDVAGGGSGGGNTAATSSGYSFKFNSNGAVGKASYSSLGLLDKLQGKGGDQPVSTAPGVNLSETAKRGISASENKQADDARAKMGTETLESATRMGLVQNASALNVANQSKIDLQAAKEAEQIKYENQARAKEKEALATTNAQAKAARQYGSSQETQVMLVNLMKEQLNETRAMHSTMREINRGIQKLASGGGNDLRGGKAAAPMNVSARPATPPETVPVPMSSV